MCKVSEELLMQYMLAKEQGEKPAEKCRSYIREIIYIVASTP